MEELSDIAILAYRAGRYRDAIECLRVLTDDKVDNALACFYLALSYEKLGYRQDAQRIFDKIEMHTATGLTKRTNGARGINETQALSHLRSIARRASAHRPDASVNW